MENKIPDIESLFDKLHSFEAEPNESAWVVIQDKLKMGLDDLLEDLKEIEIEPDKKSEVFILAHLGFHNPVDVFLKDRFGSLEIDPEKSLDEIIPKNRNRRERKPFSIFSREKSKTSHFIKTTPNIQSYFSFSR